jgi:signal transduction histidine kinase
VVRSKPADSQKTGKSAVVDEILDEFQRRLATRDDWLLRHPDISRELTRQVRSIVQDALADEWRRISRELHDSIGHSMALALQHLDLHEYFVTGDPERAQRELDAAVNSLNESLRAVRHLSAELRHSVRKTGLKRALEEYLRTNAPQEVRIDLNFTGDIDTLPSNICEEMYLILREVIRNALRHAQPTELSLAIVADETAVMASFADNGHGFDMSAVRNLPGGGLSSVTERVRILGGTLDINSAVGEGTSIAFHVPVARDRDADSVGLCSRKSLLS